MYFKELFALIFLLVERAHGGCVVEAPHNHDSPQIGLVFVPGATIAGDKYLPLMRAVQRHYPGSLWVAGKLWF